MFSPGQEWKLADAKARFSELFRRAFEDGPQRITRQGKDAVIVIREDDFDRLSQATDPRRNLADFLLESPLHGAELDIEREREPEQEREVDL